MAQELIISISGMRGIVGENLSPSIAAEYGATFGTFIRKQSGHKKPCVCIGRDSRPSGTMLENAVAAGLCASGCDVVQLGIVTTPGVGIMLRELDCAGGVVITASHNPTPYNGIKLLLDNGIAPPKPLATKIRDMYLAKEFKLVDAMNCGTVKSSDETDRIHIDKVLATVDVDLIASKKFTVVLDSVNGAGGRAGKKLLKALGCKVIGMNLEATGIFAHTPEPTKENLVDLCAVVKENRADAGFAQDPDADRLAIVSDAGTYIGEEYTLALSAKLIYSEMQGFSAANLSTSRMIDFIADKAGCDVIRTAVGEANVAEAMVENNCVIGGEGNGGVIDLRVGPVRDSLVAMALVLQLMAKTDKSITELVSEIPSLSMKKVKFDVQSSQIPAVLEASKKLFTDAKVDTSDGYRFDFDNGWVHLRGSNTEPIMRLIVEADSEDIAQGYLDKVKVVCESFLGG